MRAMRAFVAVAAMLLSAAAPAQDDDPYLWLEETQGQRALDWVAAQNARSRTALEAGKAFDRHRQEAATILNDRNRLAMPRAAGADIVNFWQDATNVRGLWRAAERRGFIAGAPQWRTLIDLDALSARLLDRAFRGTRK